MPNQRDKSKKLVGFFATEKEKAALQKAAKQHGYASLADFLRAVASGAVKVSPHIKALALAPQKWMRAFTTARQPLHRLRGLYADDVARLTADAITARLGGVQAASEALGHTSTKTTTRHYLSAEK